jgi:hypothetical protein
VRRTEEIVFGILTCTGSHTGGWPLLRREAGAEGVRLERYTAAELLRLARHRQSLPDVVYNRVATRSQERSAAVRGAKTVLNGNNIPYFNERFFDKREVLSALQGDVRTAGLLPPTLLDPDLTGVRSLLETGSAVYLKPQSGSYGEGICRIERYGSGYRMSRRSGEVTVVNGFDTLRACLAATRAQMRRTAHVVQQAVALRRYDGAPTDFRLHIQRVEDDWEVVAIGAKVARCGALTTHVRAGGRVEAGDVVLRDWFGAGAASMRERMESAARCIAVRLRACLDPGLAELGIDMGIADDGQFGVFEANAKPGRAIFLHPRLRTAGVRSCHLLLAHGGALVERSGRRHFSDVGRAQVQAGAVL